jgi:hypothetical protein
LNRHRKHIPSVIQITGDHIQAKRYEKGLHPYQVAGKLGVETALIMAWKSGARKPDPKQWQALSDCCRSILDVTYRNLMGECLFGLAQRKTRRRV